jgi:hypothetical protein
VAALVILRCSDMCLPLVIARSRATKQSEWP